MNDAGLVSFTVRDLDGNSYALQAPVDMSLSLMEIMKAEGVPVLATCGGMALCATCHVFIEYSARELQAASDEELDMLDTLPSAKNNSRLSCQLKISSDFEGAKFHFVGESND
jgi:2Fe-2S ferredoxin